MPNVATGEDASGLTSQIMSESAAAISEHVASKTDQSEEVTPPAENEEVETPEVPVEEVVEPEVPPVVEPEPETPPEAGTVKLGNREFASTADATKEYNRVIGHSAQLAGEKSAMEKQLAAAKEEIEAARSANQQWVEYYQAQENGDEIPKPETPAQKPGMTAEEIAKITEDTIVRRETLAKYEAEIDALEALPNYPQVVDTIVSLAEQINPFTGVFYTPKEAYTAACHHLGIENQAVTSTKTVSAPRTVANPAAVAAAARPMPGKGVSATPSGDVIDPAEKFLQDQFARLNSIT